MSKAASMSKPSRQAQAAGTDAKERPTGETKQNGRPTSYTQALGDEICGRVAVSTDSMKTICAGERMPDATTVFRWLRVHPEFKKQYDDAKREQAELLVEEMLAIADDTQGDTIETERGEIPNKEWMMRSRLRVETRKWLVAKLLPKKYGEKVEVDTKVSGSVEHHHTMTEERRKLLMERRRAARDGNN